MSALRGCRAGTLQKAGDRGGVEVEHPGVDHATGLQLVHADRWHIDDVSVGRSALLTPQDDDVVTIGQNVRLKPSVVGRLQAPPCSAERVRVARDGVVARIVAAIGKTGSLVDHHVGIIHRKVGRPSRSEVFRIASGFDRLEQLAYNGDVCRTAIAPVQSSEPGSLC